MEVGIVIVALMFAFGRRGKRVDAPPNAPPNPAPPHVKPDTTPSDDGDVTDDNTDPMDSESEIDVFVDRYTRGNLGTGCYDNELGRQVDVALCDDQFFDFDLDQIDEG